MKAVNIVKEVESLLRKEHVLTHTAHSSQVIELSFKVLECHFILSFSVLSDVISHISISRVKKDLVQASRQS